MVKTDIHRAKLKTETLFPRVGLEEVCKHPWLAGPAQETRVQFITSMGRLGLDKKNSPTKVDSLELVLFEL